MHLLRTRSQSGLKLLYGHRASAWRSKFRGADAISDHEERAPNALAHGPVKSSDIERVRRDIGKCAAHVAREDEASVTYRVRRLVDRDGAAATAGEGRR